MHRQPTTRGTSPSFRLLARARLSAVISGAARQGQRGSRPRAAPLLSGAGRDTPSNWRRPDPAARVPPARLPHPNGDLHHYYDRPMTVPDMSSLGLAPVFSPAQAAEILRNLGLEDLTECALRTRAYRRQVPFHQNGRRITFTVADIREIAEGHPHRPESQTRVDRSAPSSPPQMRRRRSPAEGHDARRAPWRARRTQGA
jgi:hypothetical protein